MLRTAAEVGQPVVSSAFVEVIVGKRCEDAAETCRWRARIGGLASDVAWRLNGRGRRMRSDRMLYKRFSPLSISGAAEWSQQDLRVFHNSS